MPHRIPRRFVFALERWIQKGVVHQLLLMAALVVLVAVIGGLAAWLTTSKFANVPEASWWAFLRLTDPGYLGDDEGLALRVISTIVTVLGYVLFMGSLIAILTQGLSFAMRRLESGLTPITMQGHLVILGWTNRTPEIVAKLLGGRGRLDRFLEGRAISRLRIVVQAEEIDAERRLAMREHLGALWEETQVFLRSGSSLRPEHLERLDLRRASVVIVPGADFELGGADLTDARVVKTLLTLAKLFRGMPIERRPHVVAEIFDAQKIDIARSALGGNGEVVTTDGVISRLVSQSIRHRGLAEILLGILSHRQGNSLYLRGFPELAGAAPYALQHAFPKAVVLGVVRSDSGELRTMLDPRESETLLADDLLVLLAESFADCSLAGAASQVVAEQPKFQPFVAPVRERVNRLLVLGWSRKVSGLLAELAGPDSSQHVEVTLVSRVPIADRDPELGLVDGIGSRVSIRNLCGDYAIERTLASVNPAGFDHVLFVASGWMESSEEADARTVLGYVLLRSLLEKSANPPEVLVELLDPSNAPLLEEDRRGLVFVSPRLLSHVLAHVALRPELNAVFDALFCSGGTEFDLLYAGDLGLAGRTLSFAEIQTAVLGYGVVALGVTTGSGSARAIHMNPDRSRSWSLAEQDEVVVLSTP